MDANADQIDGEAPSTPPRELRWPDGPLHESTRIDCNALRRGIVRRRDRRAP